MLHSKTSSGSAPRGVIGHSARHHTILTLCLFLMAICCVNSERVTSTNKPCGLLGNPGCKSENGTHMILVTRPVVLSPQGQLKVGAYERPTKAGGAYINDPFPLDNFGLVAAGGSTMVFGKLKKLGDVNSGLITRPVCPDPNDCVFTFSFEYNRQTTLASGTYTHTVSSASGGYGVQIVVTSTLSQVSCVGNTMPLPWGWTRITYSYNAKFAGGQHTISIRCYTSAGGYKTYDQVIPYYDSSALPLGSPQISILSVSVVADAKNEWLDGFIIMNKFYNSHLDFDNLLQGPFRQDDGFVGTFFVNDVTVQTVITSSQGLIDKQLDLVLMTSGAVTAAKINGTGKVYTPQPFSDLFVCEANSELITNCRESCVLGNGTRSCSGTFIFCDKIRDQYPKQTQCSRTGMTSDCFCYEAVPNGKQMLNDQRVIYNKTELLTANVTRKEFVRRLERSRVAKTFEENTSRMRLERSSARRRLFQASVGEQFTVSLRDGILTVVQDYSKAPLLATSGTIYNLKMYIRSDSMVSQILGDIFSVHLSDAFKQHTGLMTVVITDAAGNVRHSSKIMLLSPDDCDGEYAISPGTVKENWNCMSTTARLRYVLVTIAIMMFILSLLVKMFRSYVGLMKDCKTALENSCFLSTIMCCCKKRQEVKSDSGGIYVPVQLVEMPAKVTMRPFSKKVAPIGRSLLILGLIIVVDPPKFVNVTLPVTADDSCSNGHFNPSNFESCVNSGLIDKCEMNYQTDLTFESMATTACVNVVDQKTNQPMGTIHVELLENKEFLPSKFMYMTHVWEPAYQTSQRCGNVAPCDVWYKAQFESNPAQIFDNSIVTSSPGRLWYRETNSLSLGFSCLFHGACVVTRTVADVANKPAIRVFKTTDDSIETLRLRLKLVTAGKEKIIWEGPAKMGESFSNEDFQLSLNFMADSGTKTTPPKLEKYYASIGTCSMADLSDKDLVSSKDICVSSQSTQLYKMVKEEFVSLVDQPVKDLIGDIQTSEQEPTMFQYRMAEGLFQVYGSQLDQVSFSKPGASLLKDLDILPLHEPDYAIFADELGVTVTSRASQRVISMSLRSLRPVVFSQLTNSVCPNLEKDDVKIQGEWGTRGGCFMMLELCSSCKAGDVVLNTTSEHMLITTGIRNLHEKSSTSDCQVRVEATCSSKEMPTVEFTVCAYNKDKSICKTGHTAPSVLKDPPSNVIPDSGADARSTIITPDGTTTSSSNPNSLTNFVMGFFDFFAGLVGGTGIWSGIEGILVSVGFAILTYLLLVYLVIPFLSGVVQKYKEDRLIERMISVKTNPSSSDEKSSLIRRRL